METIEDIFLLAVPAAETMLTMLLKDRQKLQDELNELDRTIRRIKALTSLTFSLPETGTSAATTLPTSKPDAH